jgi:hypothetical protein
MANWGLAHFMVKNELFTYFFIRIEVLWLLALFAGSRDWFVYKEAFSRAIE